MLLEFATVLALAGTGVRLEVTPERPIVGAAARIELRAGRLVRVEAVAPRGRVLRVRMTRAGRSRWTGAIRFDREGRWTIRAARARLSVTVRPRAPAPPQGFGPLGRAGCDPPSPRVGQEVFGTALGGRLWALFFSGTWASAEAAVLDGVVGKRAKIVFRWSEPAFPVAAMAPDGTMLDPESQTFHPSSTWRRPGSEWGTIWIFSQPGCWRIHVTAGGAAADVWLLVRS